MRDFVNSTAYMFGVRGDFFVLFDARFAAGYPAETPDLKFPMVVLSLQLDKYVVGGGVAVWHVEIKNGAVFFDVIFRRGTFYGCVPVFGSHSIREETAGAATDFRLCESHALEENNQNCAFFKIGLTISVHA